MSVKDSLRALCSALGAESTAKSIKGILREIAIAEEAEGTGRTVADLIMEIAVAKNALFGMTVDFNIADTTDLLGKYDYELQEGMANDGKKFTGTLLKVEDYTGFSGDEEMQKGHFIAMHCVVPDVAGATINFVSRKGTKYPVDPTDGLIVIRVVDPTVFKFEISKDGMPTVEKVFDVRGLVLEKEVRPTT